MLGRCAAAANGTVSAADDQREANVFRLAAMVLQFRFAAESERLMRASESYFTQHPEARLDPAEVVRRGWVFTAPRLHDMLGRRLSELRAYHAGR